MLPESAHRRSVVGWTPNTELASVSESLFLRSNDIAVTYLSSTESSLTKDKQNYTNLGKTLRSLP
jgi:hypothetical protein